MKIEKALNAFFIILMPTCRVVWELIIKDRQTFVLKHILDLNNILSSRIILLIRNVSLIVTKDIWFWIVRVCSNKVCRLNLIGSENLIIRSFKLIVLFEKGIFNAIKEWSTVIDKIAKLISRRLVCSEHKDITSSFIISREHIGICLIIPDFCTNNSSEITIFYIRIVLIKSWDEILVVFLSSILKRFKFSMAKSCIVFICKVDCLNICIIKCCSVEPVWG